MAQPIREMLDAREREVRRSIADIRAKQLLPLERELAEIVAARKAIGALEDEQMNCSEVFDNFDPNDFYMRMTYEELARLALSGQFDAGATISELLAFIRTEYGRDISQGSFSPVLSRMRAAGSLTKTGKVWILQSTGRGAAGVEFDL